MNALMRRVFAVGVAVAATVVGAVAPGEPAVAGTCQRTVGIEGQESVSESIRTLVFSVFSGGCAAPGTVAYTVMSGSAQATVDFQLASGHLQWAAGDLSARLITATIVPDLEPEAGLEDFTVRLAALSADLSVVNAIGEGRILDDDRLGLVWSVDDEECDGLVPSTWCVCQGMPDPVDCVSVELDLSALSDGSAAARWSTVDGDARAGVDFVRVVDQVQPVLAGAASATLPVRLLPRPAGTPTRWFYVRISAVSSGAIADAVAVVTLGAT